MVSVVELKRNKDVDGLINALKDSYYWVRKSAAYALGEIGDTRAIEPLIEALNDSDYSVRENAAYALREIGDPAVEPLIKALGDSDGYVRFNAAKALGEIGDARAVDPLIKKLGDSNRYVRDAAKEALKKLGYIPPEHPTTETKLDDKNIKQITESINDLKELIEDIKKEKYGILIDALLSDNARDALIEKIKELGYLKPPEINWNIQYPNPTDFRPFQLEITATNPNSETIKGIVFDFKEASNNFELDKASLGIQNIEPYKTLSKSVTLTPKSTGTFEFKVIAYYYGKTESKSINLSVQKPKPDKTLEEIENLLNFKKQVVLIGPPGTGKTYHAKRFAEYFTGNS
ncbi:MAG: HEAT repeat domain-containing protein, partial [Methanosarcinales archaeon]